jgi:hypothetical protein
MAMPHLLVHLMVHHTQWVAAAVVVPVAATTNGLILSGEIPDGSRVLCAHLRGAPALNGYRFHFRNG